MKRTKSFITSCVGIILLLTLSVGPAAAAPSNTAFTYQGQLKDSGGNLVTAACDFTFKLYDDSTAGNPVGASPVVTQTAVLVSRGLFTTQLDFGTGAFDGSVRWLEIAVGCPTGTSLTTLNPRQALTPAPYAIYAVNANQLDGYHASSFQQHYKNMVVVAQGGGDYTTITAALASITPTASTTNLYLIYVAPGVYSETITMWPYVDIEGAGELTTKITAAGSNSTSPGTVIGANNAELRFLTVENTGGITNAVAIYNRSAAPRLTHLTATASGGTTLNYGVLNVSNSSPTMTNVTASASGGSNTNYGVSNNFSSPAMTNVTASASGATNNNYGVSNNNSSPTMTNVTASASGGTDNYGVYNNTSSPTMTVISATASGGTTNYGVYNGSGSLPLMTDVRATASGGTLYNFGVHNTGSSPTMMDVRATAFGGTGSFGVWNFNSSPTMLNMTVVASGGGSNFGLENDSSSPTIRNSVISGSGGTISNEGIHNYAVIGAYTVTINNSQIVGSGSTINTDVWVGAAYTTTVGASQFVGTGGKGSGGGSYTYICIYSYKGDYTTLTSNCQ